MKSHLKMGGQLLDLIEIQLKLPWPCFIMRNPHNYSRQSLHTNSDQHKSKVLPEKSNTFTFFGSLTPKCLENISKTSLIILKKPLMPDEPGFPLVALLTSTPGGGADQKTNILSFVCLHRASFPSTKSVIQLDVSKLLTSQNPCCNHVDLPPKEGLYKRWCIPESSITPFHPD